MSSQPSSYSRSFELLDERIQRWIWQSNWLELKDAQERAIPVILEGQRDVVIAAATASGKTEAAALPVLTRLLSDTHRAPCALYVSPLKALINDQWRRLDNLCESLEIRVTPWHGDISDTKKKHFLNKPSGCILITPESLEALLINRGSTLPGIFDGLRYVIVDELHAFIGSERGKQLQSLLNRLEFALKRRIPRIALSATLGDMRSAAEFLRPGNGDDVEIIEGKDDGHELKVLLKGYRDLPPRLSDKELSALQEQGATIEMEDTVSGGVLAIGDHLFKTLRGSKNLIFPNSRRNVELFSDLLRRQCERLRMPNEFWPHHGSLAKSIREEAEVALKGEQPATAVCTTTLELGIDIGAVKSVAQVGPAPSVASLRQRLGRSGRRKGEPAILYAHCVEAELAADLPLSDELREGLIETIAQIRLLTQGWYEPPRIYGLHLSTLIQQLLSLIAQYGGATAGTAWSILCESGVFKGITKEELAALLRGLAAKDVLMQDPSGLLLLAPTGEKIVNHYAFYAAFATDEEYRIVCNGKTLGTLPISRPLAEGSFVIFAGRRWRVVGLYPSEKLIEVTPAAGGRPPLFDGMAGKIDDRVRQEMRTVLAASEPVTFLDKQALPLLDEARSTYRKLNLDKQSIVQTGNNASVFTWRGDLVNDTLVLLLSRKGIRAENQGMYIEVQESDVERIGQIFQDISEDEYPAPEHLAESVGDKLKGKWDWLLTEELLCKSFASSQFDVSGALTAAKAVSNIKGAR